MLLTQFPAGLMFIVGLIKNQEDILDALTLC